MVGVASGRLKIPVRVDPPSLWFRVATALLAVAIFVADTATDFEVSVSVLYVVVVLMASRFLQRRGTAWVAATCVALAAISAILTPPRGVALVGVANTLVSIAAITITTYLVLLSQARELVLKQHVEERKRAEEALHRREKELQDIFDTIPAIVVATLPDGSGGIPNRRWSEYTGSPLRPYGRVEPDNPSWREATFIHPADIDNFLEVWARCMAAGEPLEHEVRLRRADREYRWMLVRAVPLRDEQGNIVRWYWVDTDIEDRKRAEEAARRRERELQDILDTIPVIAFVHLPDGSGGVLNRRWLEYTGSPPRQFGSLEPNDQAWRESTYIHPDDFDGFFTVWSQCLASGKSFEYEARLRRADGEYHWLLVRAVPLRDEHGNIVKWYGVSIDIEDRKRAEEAVRRREKELQDIFDTIPVIAFVTLPDGSGAVANRRWLEYTGRPMQSQATIEPDNQAWREATYIHPEDLDGFAEAWKRSIATGEPFEYQARLRRADGAYRWMLVRAVPLRDEHGNILKWYGIDTDIEDRKRTEDALRHSEAYLAGAQKLTQTGSWAMDGKSRELLYWSEEMFRMYGFDPQQALPKREQARQRIHPEDRNKIEKRDDKTFFERADSEVEFRIVLPDGTVKHIHALAHPVVDVNGEVVEVVGTNVDITERKRSEQLQADLAHTNRVSMLGELTASITHELKQPITGAITNARVSKRWLNREQPELDQVRQGLDRIERDGARATAIIDRLRALYKKTAPKREPVDVNEIIGEMAIMLRSEATGNAVSIRSVLAADLPKIMVDRVQLQQVLMNLMLNGIEAMNETGGVLTVKSQPEDGRVLISVSDTGVGLPADNTDRIFDAFFTTKPQGSGMGLAISRSIIESHGGRLWATPNDGRGASFHFSLPTATEAAEAPAAGA